MILTKKAQENIIDSMVIASKISNDCISKDMKAIHELKKALFELTGIDYKTIEKELNSILDEVSKQL